MDIKDMFKAKGKPTTIEQILDKDQVKQVTSNFVENHMATARAVIILWATPAGDIRLAIGGGIPNECTALGVLCYGEHIIINEGMLND